MVLLVAAMMLMLDHGGVLVLVLVAGFGKRQLPLSSIRNRYDSADDAALFFLLDVAPGAAVGVGPSTHHHCTPPTPAPLQSTQSCCKYFYFTCPK